MRGTGGSKSRAAVRQMRGVEVEGVTLLLPGSDLNEREHPGGKVILVIRHGRRFHLRCCWKVSVLLET